MSIALEAPEWGWEVGDLAITTPQFAIAVETFTPPLVASTSVLVDLAYGAPSAAVTISFNGHDVATTTLDGTGAATAVTVPISDAYITASPAVYPITANDGTSTAVTHVQVDDVLGTISLTLVESTLAVSPGSLTAKVANAAASATATFSVTGSTAAATTADLDATGAVGAVAVPVAVPTAGSYVLTVTDGTDTASTPFTVLFIATPGGLVVPTITPPAAIQNTTGVKKWVFQDPAGSDYYHFPYNPNNMTSPYGQKNITYQATTAIDGNKLAWEGQEAAVQWQFEGFIRSQAEYDAFVYWRDKRNRIWVTDHYGRAWLGYITSFDPKPRRSMGVPWSHTYTISFLIFAGPVTPVEL